MRLAIIYKRCILGVGRTINEAITDAVIFACDEITRDKIMHRLQMSVRPFLNCGEVYIVPCTADVYNAVIEGDNLNFYIDTFGICRLRYEKILGSYGVYTHKETSTGNFFGNGADRY